MSYPEPDTKRVIAAQCACLDKLIDGVIRGYRMGEGSDVFPWALDVTLADGEDVVVTFDVADSQPFPAAPGAITIGPPDVDDAEDED